MSYVPLYTSESGVRWLWQDDESGPGAKLLSVQQVSPILERNQAMAGHNDGYTPSRDMARIASIPLSIIYLWLTTEGWDALSTDPDCQKKLAQKLDDPEWRYLRTSELVLGDIWRKHI